MVKSNAANKAFPRPKISKPETRKETRYRTIPLMTKTKRPKVITVKGMVKKSKIGFKNTFNIPNIKLPKIKALKFSIYIRSVMLATIKIARLKTSQRKTNDLIIILSLPRYF